jgi:hypothetical protein
VQELAFCLLGELLEAYGLLGLRRLRGSLQLLGLE